MSDARLIAGAMSGTSADGVDVAVCRIAARGLAMQAELLGHHHVRYDDKLRQALLAVRSTARATLAELAHIGEQISRAHVACVRGACDAADVKPRDLRAVAAHGQTLFHAPPRTIQWLDPALIAQELGCAVVSDFRRADCAAGGQGAPLVPFADFILFGHPNRHRVLLNIGGIANVTLLPAGGDIDDLRAFDTGPGNCISDHLMAGRGGVDVDGAMALRGQADEAVVQRVLADAYFHQPPPKSTDGPAMIGLFEQAVGQGQTMRLEDQLATAAQIVAVSIVGAIRSFSPWGDAAFELIASGGGVHNRAIMARLREHLRGATFTPIEDLGVNPSAKEAMAFALLGAATLDGEPSNVPAATGASRRVVLGSITQA